MREILKRTRAARRRMMIVEFVRLTFVAVFWAMLVGIALVGVHRWVTPLPLWTGFALGGGAFVAAAIGAALRRPSMRTAALALDEAAGLEERITTALFVKDDGSDAAQAILRDAERALQDAEAAGIPFGRPRFRALATAATVLLAVVFVPLAFADGDGGNGNGTADNSPIVPEPIRKEQSKALRNRAYHLEKRARELQNTDLEELAEQMRKVAQELRREETTRNEALAKISSLEEKVREQREEELSKYGNELQERLKKLGAGDADSKNEGLGEKAKKLSELTQKIKAAKKQLEQDPSEEKAKELKDNLEKMKSELKETLGDLEGLQGEDLGELAGKLGEMLEELDPSDLEGMDEMLGELGDMMGDFDDLVEGLDLLGALEGELGELGDIKDCFCEGEGECEFCGGLAEAGEHVCGQCAGMFGAGSGQGAGAGSGFGRGPGRGPDGKSNPDDELVPVKEKSRLSKGDIIGAIRFKTLPEKGKVRSGYKAAYKAMAAEAAEALQQEEIPPGYRMHVRDYFDSIRPDKED